MTRDRIVVIEDDSRTREGLVTKINSSTGKTVDPVEPPHLEYVQEVVEDDVGLYVIDYDLTSTLEDGTSRNYMGGTLLNKLRETNPDIPLVLVTRKSVYMQHSQLRDMGEIADLVFFKGQIDDKNLRIGRKLNSLMNGFESIRGIKPECRTWNELASKIKSTELESSSLLEAKPPIGPDDSLRTDFVDPADYLNNDQIELKLSWSAHEAAKWITGTLFRFPGIFYDKRYAASSLGIETHSFETGGIMKEFESAKYEGIFSDYDDFWWRGRLQNTAKSMIGGLKPATRLVETFVPRIQDNPKYTVIASECNSSKEPYADTVCYILKEQVKTRYSLVYFPDNRPSIMESARVSFKAIKHSNRVKRHLFRKSDRELFDRIRGGYSE